MKKHAGFTIIELMITIAVLGVALGMAVPGLRQIILDNRLASQLNLLSSSLAMARSEAIKQNVRAILCPSSNGTTCSASGSTWNGGWLVFLDRNNNFAHTASSSGCAEGETAADCLLVAQPALGGSNTLTGGPGVPALMGYNGTGTAICDTNADGSPESCVTADTYFTLCDTRGGAKARALAISATGRTAILDKTPSGAGLSCN